MNGGSPSFAASLLQEGEWVGLISFQRSQDCILCKLDLLKWYYYLDADCWSWLQVHSWHNLNKPPMCQNMEIMIKTDPRQPCRQGHQMLHLYLIYPLRWEKEWSQNKAVGFYSINSDWLTHMWLIAMMINSWENWIIDLWGNWFIHLLMIWFFFLFTPYHDGVEVVNKNDIQKAFVIAAKYSGWRD